MKKIINPGDYTNSVSFALLILRLSVGSIMLTHGLGKLSMLFGHGPVQFADPIGIGVNASLILTVFAEFLCSLLLIIGLGTRLAAIPLIITMLVAVLIVHSADVFANKELALLYAVIYLTLIFTGGGKFSADKLLF